jgi:hypothetical protein
MNFEFFNSIYFAVIVSALVLIFLIRTFIKGKISGSKQRKGLYNTPIGDVNYFQELVLTFSNKTSLLSSKKIERFVVFSTFLTITIIFINKRIETLSTTEYLEILAVWLGYGGYNSFMNYRDKKIESKEQVTEIKDETSETSETSDTSEVEIK